MKTRSLLAIVLFSILLFSGCQESGEDSTAPQVGNGTLVVRGQTLSSVAVSWTAADDDVTETAELTYQLYYATTNALDTVASIVANGTAVGSAAAGQDSQTVTGLSPFTRYYFNVIVADKADNKAAYTSAVGQSAYRFPLGDRVDDYQYPHQLSVAQWLNGSAAYTLIKIDKSKRFAIALNSAANTYHPSKYSRFDWTEDANGQTFFCQVAYDKSTAAEAEAVDSADRSNPANGGCSGFAWSRLNEIGEPMGQFVDNYKTTHTISAGQWLNGQASYLPLKVDQTNRFLIAQNAVANTYNPSKYSRFDWTLDSAGKRYYCQSAYDKTSAAEAEAVTSTDATNPAAGGCGGFAWSELMTVADVTGDWVDDYQTSHTITTTRWLMGTSTFEITKLNPTSKYLVAQNGSANSYNPSKYSRFDWIKDASGQLYYCQIAYDKASASDAEAVNTANSSSPATGGCGSFAWSRLSAIGDISGQFTDDYHYPHRVSATRWVSGRSGFSIVKLDTTKKQATALNDAGNEFYPSKYSRFDWTQHSGQLYYCQTAYDKATQAEAEAVTAADTSNLTGGCGGFAWSRLYP